jgi:hypothetical protein
VCHTHENHLHEQQPRYALRLTRGVCNPPELRQHDVSGFTWHSDWIRLIE